MIIPYFTEASLLRFDEEEHRYMYDRSEVPSVSKIIEPVANMYYDIRNEHLVDAMEKAADRGTQVHQAIETLVKFDIEDIASEFRGYLDAFKDWKIKHDVQVCGQEIMLYHSKLKYAGTTDMLCMVDGVPSIVDFKTSSKVAEVLCRLQLEAYKMAYLDMFPSEKLERKIVVHLKKTGKFVCHEYEANDRESAMMIYSLVNLRSYYKKYCK